MSIQYGQIKQTRQPVVNDFTLDNDQHKVLSLCYINNRFLYLPGSVAEVTVVLVTSASVVMASVVVVGIDVVPNDGVA